MNSLKIVFKKLSYTNVVWWWDKRVRRTANKITTGLVQINSLTKYLTLQRKAQRKSYILTSQIFIRYKVLNPNPKFRSITLLYVQLHNRQVVLLNFRSNDPNYVRGSNNVRSLLVNTAVTIEIVNFENDNLDLYIQKCYWYIIWQSSFDQISKRDWFTVRPFIYVGIFSR